jgi:subtilisin family serine protease
MRVSVSHKFTVGVLIASLALSALSLGTTNAVSAQVPMRYVVLGSGGTLPIGLESLVAASGGTIISRVDEIGMAVIESAEPNFLDAVTALPGIAAAGEDIEVMVAPSLEGVVVEGAEGVELEGANPAAATNFFLQWNLRNIGADQAWAADFKGIPQVKVAVIDTGIDYTHRELSGRVDMVNSKSFVEERPLPKLNGIEVKPFIDLHGHGSHLAGIIATNAVSIAGTNRYVTLLAVKVATRSGFASIATIAEAIVYAANQGADVINMSFFDVLDKTELKTDHLKQTIMAAINYAHAKGALLVASAGNSGINWDDKDHKKLTKFPVAFPHVVGASASGPFFGGSFDNMGLALLTNGSYAQYADYGRSVVDFAAPGGSSTKYMISIPNPNPKLPPTLIPADSIFSVCTRFFRSANPMNPFPCSSGAAGLFAVGSSMSAAHVSGAAALIDSAFGGALTGDQILAILKRGAEDKGTPGKDEFYGYGRINVFRSLAP